MQFYFRKFFIIRAFNKIVYELIGHILMCKIVV